MSRKVALYARVSTKGQDGDNQLLRLRDVAVRRGWDFVEYSDVASGANARRPQLDAMLADAKKGKIDHIMVTKLDRLARSVTNLSEIIDNLENWGVTIEFLDQPIDTSTAMGRLLRTILGAIAEFERELISDRTKDGLARAVSQGKTLGRRKIELSAYQKDKLRRILADNPDISMRQLSTHFEGISRKTLSDIVKRGEY